MTVALKPRDWNVMEVGEEFGPLVMEVTDFIVRCFGFAVDDFAPEYINAPDGDRIAHPTVLCKEARDVIRTAYELSSGGSGMHTKHEVELFRPARIGETVTVTGRHIDKYMKRDKQYIVVEAEVKDADGSFILRQRSWHMRGLKEGVAKAVPVKSPAAVSVPTILGRPIVNSLRDVAVGAQLRPLRKTTSQEQFTAFAGADYPNIHNNLDVARAAGLRTTAASGLQPAGYVSELMTSIFGEGWRSGGKMFVAFIAPLYLGDVVYTSGEITVIEDTPEGRRATAEVWVENQTGTRVLAGQASAFIR